MPIFFVVGLPLLLLILGVLLLARGMRGVAIDDHPLCRKCGFDLTGRPEGVNRCSECGAELSHPHAIRIGHRRRRSGLIVGGVMLLAIVLAVGGGGTWVALSSSDWRQYAPVWWLLYEAGGLDATSRDAAITELATRLGAGKLDQQQIDSLADQALALQADKNATWIPAWGDMIETAHAASKLSPERRQRYLFGALNLRLEVRSDLRRGDRLPYWVHSEKSRVGTRSTLYSQHKDIAFDIGPVHEDKGQNYGGGSSMLSFNGGGASGSNYDLDKYIVRLPDGKIPIKQTLEVGIGTGWNAKPMATTQFTMSTTFTLHPASQPTVKVIHDPSLRGKVEKALTCSNITYQQYATPSQNPYVNVTINVAHLPVGVGYDIFAVIDGKEYKLGTMAAPVNGRFGGYGTGGQAPPTTQPTVDVILKPSVEAATLTVDTFEIWDEPITIKNVKVQQPIPPATTKSAK